MIRSSIPTLWVDEVQISILALVERVATADFVQLIANIDSIDEPRLDANSEKGKISSDISIFRVTIGHRQTAEGPLVRCNSIPNPRKEKRQVESLEGRIRSYMLDLGRGEYACHMQSQHLKICGPCARDQWFAKRYQNHTSSSKPPTAVLESRLIISITTKTGIEAERLTLSDWRLK